MKYLGIKGLYNSLRYSNFNSGLKPEFRCSSNVLIQLSDRAKIDLDQNSVFELGFSENKHSSHPMKGKSKFRMEEGSKLEVRNGFVALGPESVVNIEKGAILERGGFFIH